jgi:hypothetical protein
MGVYTAADFGCDNVAVPYKTVKIHIFQNGHMVHCAGGHHVLEKYKSWLPESEGSINDTRKVCRSISTKDIL